MELSEAQWEALIRLQVDERMDHQARLARCILDAGCLAPAPAPAELEERRRAVIELIGEKNLAPVRAQERRGVEDYVVEKLQSRLPPDLKLRPAEEQALLDALGDELQHIDREQRSGGRTTATWGGYGAVPYVKVYLRSRRTWRSRARSRGA